MGNPAYGPESNPACLPAPPEICGCEPVCEKKCACPTSAVKTRARDAIRMRPGETGRTLKFREWGCDGRDVTGIVDCLKLVIRRKAACEPLGVIEQFLLEGSDVRVVWPDWFRTAPEGYYEADVMIQGCEERTLLFHKTGRAVLLTESTPEVGPYSCGTGCDDPCLACG